MALQRWRSLLPGLWAGWLACVALMATPVAFALLSPADAARVVGRILATEAYVSLVLGLLVLTLERRAARQPAASGASVFSTDMVLAFGTLFCTVAGYFGLQPLMTAARAGQGVLSFGQLHAVSAALYGIKLVLVAALAWRAAGTAGLTAPIRSPSS